MIIDWEIKKKDLEGNKFEIRINFNDANKRLYIRDVGMIKKGKRKVWWISDSLKDDYTWRRLDGIERREAQVQKILEYVPKELLLEAITEVWELMKPNEIFFNSL